MNLGLATMEAPAARAARSRLRFSPAPEVLRQVQPPQRGGVAPDLAVWNRQAPADFLAWVAALPEDCLPCLELVAEAQVLGELLQDAFEFSGMPAGLMRKLLLADLQHLVLRFADLAGCSMLHLRLGDLQSEADRQWLCMGAPLRLVCSYRGPASECRGTSSRPSLESAWSRAEGGGNSALAAMDVVVFNARGRMLHRRSRYNPAEGRPKPWALSLVAATATASRQAFL